MIDNYLTVTITEIGGARGHAYFPFDSGFKFGRTRAGFEAAAHVARALRSGTVEKWSASIWKSTEFGPVIANITPPGGEQTYSGAPLGVVGAGIGEWEGAEAEEPEQWD